MPRLLAALTATLFLWLTSHAVALTWQVIVNDGDSILEALDLEARYRISFWDALVVQAAQASGAEVLYSEDLSDGQMCGSVRIVNPLQARG